MSTTIKLKNGSGAPLAGDLVQGEPALDLTNKRLYTENASGTVIEVGTNPTSLTTGTFTSTGIDDNATSTAITIDSSENVGIGTASPAQKLDVNGTAVFGGATTRLTTYSDTTYSGIFNGSSLTSDEAIYMGGDSIFFYGGGAERMRIDSSGDLLLGGTTSYTSFLSASTGNLQVNGGIIGEPGSGNAFEISNYRSAPITFLTSGNIERMRIDSSGSVHIGPSANDSQGYTIDLSPDTQKTAGIDVSSTSPNVNLDLYAGGSPSNLGGWSGQIRFLTGGSSSLGTERMRIDSSGRVGIGTSDPSSGTSTYYDDLVIKNATSGTGAGITIQSNTTNGFGAVEFRKADGTQVGKMYASSADGQLAFETGGSERMRIDSSGNVILNQSAGAADNTILRITGGTAGFSTLHLADTADDNVGNIQYNHTTNSLAFDVNNAERMRIDSSGNLLVGTTVTPTYGVMNLKNPSDVARWEVGPNTTGNFVVYNQSAVGVYLTDGGTSWTGTSDERLKENINDIGPVLETIKNYQCVNFSYKANQSKKANSIGFIAQDWENDFPNVIETDDSGYLGIKYTETIPVLLKAIQEQQAMIEELKAEVAALKGA